MKNKSRDILRNKVNELLSLEINAHHHVINDKNIRGASGAELLDLSRRGRSLPHSKVYVNADTASPARSLEINVDIFYIKNSIARRKKGGHFKKYLSYLLKEYMKDDNLNIINRLKKQFLISTVNEYNLYAPGKLEQAAERAASIMASAAIPVRIDALKNDFPSERWKPENKADEFSSRIDNDTGTKLNAIQFMKNKWKDMMARGVDRDTIWEVDRPLMSAVNSLLSSARARIRASKRPDADAELDNIKPPGISRSEKDGKLLGQLGVDDNDIRYSENVSVKFRRRVDRREGAVSSLGKETSSGLKR